MKCPGCHFEQPDGSTACLGCGLIFAKWRESQPEVRPVPGDSKSAAPLQPKPILLPLLAVCVVVSLVIVYFIRKDPMENLPPVSGVPRASTPAVGAASTETMASPVPTDTPAGPAWKFQGKVLDVLRLVPIAGATVVFMEGTTVVTDAGGKFEAEVPARSQGYLAELSHPEYGTNYWEQDFSGLSREDRLRVRGQIPFHSSLKGDSELALSLNFGMFPAKITPEEEREWHKVIDPKAGD